MYIKVEHFKIDLCTKHPMSLFYDRNGNRNTFYIGGTSQNPKSWYVGNEWRHWS